MGQPTFSLEYILSLIIALTSYYYINSLNDKIQNGFSNKSKKVSKEEIHLIKDFYTEM